MPKERLDVLLTEQGQAESRSLAQRLIMAGQVRVDGQVVIKPATRVDSSSSLEVDCGQRFASRGGEKLEAAMQAFGLDDISGKVCVDVGASTGGFTDCLLQHGAVRVYAVDVGYGILHWKLRTDPRVVPMERTNARYVEGFKEPVHLVTMDASFIPLKILLPVACRWFGADGGQMVVLVKPQFEAGRQVVARGKGVVRDPEVHRQVLMEVLGFAQESGMEVRGLICSPLHGPKGNTEFLAHLGYPGKGTVDLAALVDGVLPEVEEEAS
jgi:23S rRNA (cytidine1920-2'-O)/16S rRNA (cytidine1409-2'-O)-methyltransferase